MNNKKFAQWKERVCDWYQYEFRYPSGWWGIRHVRAFFRNTFRILTYIPVLWNNEDFDHGYILELLRYKIKRTRDHIAHHQIHTEWERDVKCMDHAIELLDRVIKDDYFMEEFRAHEAKWNPTGDFLARDKDGNPIESDEGSGYFKGREHSEPEMAEFRIWADKKYAAEAQDWHELWKLFDEHLKEWWD